MRRSTLPACLMIALSKRLYSLQIPKASYNNQRNAVLFYNDVFEVQLPPTHRFPMIKYRLVRQILQREYCLNSDVQFIVSPHATPEELKLTHCPLYVDRYLTAQLNDKEIRKTGFPLNQDNILRATSSAGGTVAAMRSVLNSDSNMAGHIAGGTHHAFYDYGEGFCIFSDIAVASNIALTEFPDLVKSILIIDLDVHQGNGNAALFCTDPNVFTFSMHCKDNYFSKKEQSDIDVELDSHTGDDLYLSTLNDWLPRLFDTVQPDLVFYQAGVDIFEGDRLGKLKVSRAGLQRRNHAVYEQVMKRNLKCVVTMGGGYPKDQDPASQNFREVLECHADVYRAFIEHTLMTKAEQ